MLERVTAAASFGSDCVRFWWMQSACRSLASASTCCLGRADVSKRIAGVDSESRCMRLASCESNVSGASRSHGVLCLDPTVMVSLGKF